MRPMQPYRTPSRRTAMLWSSWPKLRTYSAMRPCGAFRRPSETDHSRSDTPTAVVVVAAPLQAGAASTATQSIPATATRPLILGDIGLPDHVRYPPMAVCSDCDHAMALPG